MLLSTLQCTGQPRTAESDLAQDVSTARAEKPCLKPSLPLCPFYWTLQLFAPFPSFACYPPRRRARLHCPESKEEDIHQSKCDAISIHIQLIKNKLLLIVTGTVLGQCIHRPGNLIKMQIPSQLVWGEA